MRRALLALLILTAAGPAPAQTSKAPPSVLSSREPPKTILPAPAALTPRQPAGDLHGCKSMCARVRYFCQARDVGYAGCGSDWVLCNRSCASAYATTPFGR
jgi:hypothetical protein